MVQSIRSAIETMTRLEKILTTFGGVSMSVAAFTAFMVGGEDLAGQVDANTKTNARQDSTIAEVMARLSATENSQEHALCLLEAIAGNGRRTAIQCSFDYGSTR